MSQVISFGGSGGGGATTLILVYTYVDTTPYTVDNNDTFLSVDSTDEAITIYFPESPTLGRVFIVKDFAGTAGSNNITLTTLSGTVTFDSDTSFVLNTQDQAAQIIFDGSNYLLF